MSENENKATANGRWPEEILNQVLARFPKVLLVDDSQTLADMLALFFKLNGFSTRAAYGGREALEAILEDAPDIAFIDLTMPEIDGMTVARQVRESPPAKAPVLVALTGWEGKSHENAAREAGFDHFLAKPVVPAKLREFMSGLVAENPIERGGGRS